MIAAVGCYCQIEEGARLGAGGELSTMSWVLGPAGSLVAEIALRWVSLLIPMKADLLQQKEGEEVTAREGHHLQFGSLPIAALHLLELWVVAVVH